MELKTIGLLNSFWMEHRVPLQHIRKDIGEQAAQSTLLMLLARELGIDGIEEDKDNA